MVVKPTTDDVWVVVLVAALLLAGAALTLRDLARSPAAATSTG
jgi:Sec-independent protein translocase protein TatA